MIGKQIMHVRDEYQSRVDRDDGSPPTLKQLLEGADNPQTGGGIGPRIVQPSGESMR